METKVAVTKEQFDQLPYPYSDCGYENIESLNYESYRSHLIKHNREYSMEDCFTFCYFQSLYEHCPNNSISCVEFFVETILNKILGTCKLNCPPKCKTTEFKYQLTYLSLTNDYLENNFNTSSNQKYRKENFLTLKIYYKSLIQRKIIKTAKNSISDMIGDIGGILGCFLGASLISMAEIFELILKIVFRFFVNNKYFFFKIWIKMANNIHPNKI